MPLHAHHDLERSVLARVGDDVGWWVVSSTALLESNQAVPGKIKGPITQKSHSWVIILEKLIKIPRRIWAEIFTVALLVVKRGRSALGKLEQREEQGVHTATQGVSKQ